MLIKIEMTVNSSFQKSYEAVGAISGLINKFPDMRCSGFSIKEIDTYDADGVAFRLYADDIKSIRQDLTDVQALKVLANVKNKYDNAANIYADIIKNEANELFPK
jgi:hypothetical protein